jgi:hypothetical protein
MNISEPYIMSSPSIEQSVIVITVRWLPIADVRDRLATRKGETQKLDIEIITYIHQHMHTIEL